MATVYHFSTKGLLYRPFTDIEIVGEDGRIWFMEHLPMENMYDKKHWSDTWSVEFQTDLGIVLNMILRSADGLRVIKIDNDPNGTTGLPQTRVILSSPSDLWGPGDLTRFKEREPEREHTFPT